MSNNFFEDWFGSFINPEQTLDKAWREACVQGNFCTYDQTLQNIKMSGKKVYRNSQGKHKVEG